MRSFAQRNNNVTQIIPQYVNYLSRQNFPSYDVSGAIYALSLPHVKDAGGVYYVDMSEVDLSGNSIDYTGRFDISGGSTYFPLVNFVLDTQLPATPGLEFTIFFKNIPFDRIASEGGNPLLTIGLMSGDAPSPYILSPPVPALMGANVFPSITFKNDGTNFNVASSGPAGWLGPFALAAVATVYNAL